MSRSAVHCAALAFSCSWLMVYTSVARCQGDLERLATMPVAGIDTSRLVRLEQKLLPPPIIAGPPAHADLAAYYFAANPELCRRMETARRFYERTGTGGFRGVTLIAGDAGVGKTYLKNYAVGNDYPKSAVCKFDIRELYEQWQQDALVMTKPDLCDQGTVINELLTLRDPQAKPLLRYLKDRAAAFYIIDSLDELHPDEYANALTQIEEFVTESEEAFVHVVVLARPFAYLEYWRRRNPPKQRFDIDLFMLAPPVFRTTGDLAVSSWNYHTWKFDARWKGPDDRIGPLSFQDYVEWAETGFSAAGRFADIACKPNREMTREINRAFVDYAQRSGVVRAALNNLAGNSIMRSIVADRVERGLAFDEKGVMDAYFNAWLERDYTSDHRPSPSHPDHLDLYLEALETVAAKYLVEDLVDDSGCFPVPDGSRVEVDHDGRRLSFPIRQLLDRSGMKHVDPRVSGTPRYRFEPVWFHRLLVDRYNNRVAAGMTLVGHSK